MALAYHQRTRHAPNAYARALGWLDWDSQPDPFRRYTGAPVVLLDREAPEAAATWELVTEPGVGGRSAVSLDGGLVSRLFLDSLALSAWKEAGDMRWSLRVNPSSGNLHPTEAYLICGPVPGIGDDSAVYHYNAYLHGLERRAILPPATWRAIAADLPPGAVLIGLSSIVWRESWKYGERAFRYCQHDLGHVIAGVSLAASALGWNVRVLESITDDSLAGLLGIARQSGNEAELPECLLVVYPGTAAFPLPQWQHVRLPALPPVAWLGTPAALSAEHHEWPILDVVAAATTKRGPLPAEGWRPAPSRRPEHAAVAGHVPPEEPAPGRSASSRPFSPLVRQRRSAVAMDGVTSLPRPVFRRMLHHLLPGAVPFDALPWAPALHLFLFVHRVDGLDPGIYALARGSALRGALDPRGAWLEVEADIGLFLVRAGDQRGAAQGVSCGQEIAANGAFALGMVADLAGGLASLGGPFYRRLHWEAGAIGQVLYLEAEAAGLRGTGIGCFFDDAMLDAVGIPRESGWKALYHFTVGGPVDDERLRTIAPYAHLG